MLTITDMDKAAYHARYNANLHCLLATRYSRLDLSAAAVAALTASGGALAGLSGSLGWGWSILLIIAALSSSLRPVLRWSELYARHNALALAYQTIEWRLPRMELEAACMELSKLGGMESASEPIRWAFLQKIADERTRRQLQYAPA